MCYNAELANLVAYTDPDVLVLTETKIDYTVHPSEFLPDGYNCAAHKDRSRCGRGIMLAFKSCYSDDAIALKDIDAETAWAPVLVNKCQKLVIDVFYRQPDHCTFQVENIEKALYEINEKYKNNPNTTCMLSGDFYSENARVCAKWQWNALDLCHWIALQDTIDKYVPERLLKIDKNNLWITPNIRRLCKTKPDAL